VGVTAFHEGNEEEPPPILQIGPEVEELQCKRLADVRFRRSADDVAATLAEVRGIASDSSRNLMPAILRAVGAYATVGEMMDAMADVFGRWRETPTI
jgi:methylmalonyl-CoA mutase N-terminal domain/subunit